VTTVPRMPAELAKTTLDVGIVTTDVDASLHFYRDLLGFTPLMTLPTPDGELHLLIAGEVMVKLMAVPDAPAGPAGDVAAATGLRYLTFWVANLPELLEELTAAGVTVVREPFEVAGTTAAMVADPGGTIVEFLHQPG
jgi:catechol 2,3-dioxygenase-like lactoylglutathione lyase family enzyme